MNATTMLLRQIHPSFVQSGRVTSQAFSPFPKDYGKLSVYDGDLIDAEPAFQHSTTHLEYQSKGVLGVTVRECSEVGLPAESDPEPFLEHAIVDFTGKDKKSIKSCAAVLRDRGMTRGWLYSD